jgi:hypothetical protein
MTTPGPEAIQKADDATFYHISFQKLAELNRSAPVVLATRRNPATSSREKLDQGSTDPQELINEIAEYRAQEEGFIQPDMPLQEIIFRIMLSRRNQPVSLEELHYQLTERWATPAKPMNISQEGLRRILESDTYYGFARVAPDTK